ncbi:MAG: YCF48-related protein [Bryobacteraceae bacterium]|nr:YCF48-related protein [Bryobacteraceae bacterium]
MKLAASLLLLLAPALLVAEPRWEMQYFYDEAKSSLTLTDIAFPSPSRGLASGWITEGNRVKPVVLVTSDAGVRWTRVPVSEAGQSLYCLDETACWMVTEKGVWFSDETGRTWRRIRKTNGISGVHFITRDHGWIFGHQKQMLETTDAGKTWKQVPEATAVKTAVERTGFYAMSFINEKSGILTGRSEPAAPRSRFPIWADADPELNRERPTLTLLVETRDAGKTWTATAASMFGRFSRLSKPSQTGVALGLIEFERYFTYASEVYQYTFSTGKLVRSFRQKDVAITDVAVVPKGGGLIGGFEPPGRLARTPVPGKVRLWLSTDFTSWYEFPVDYRAVARRVRLAVVDDSHMWAATDTGMILRLVR